MDVTFRRYILSNISSTPLVSRAVDSDSNVILIHSDTYITPSPEEQIIQQRGSRRHSLPAKKSNENSPRLPDTPGRGKYSGLKQAKRRRLLMSPQRKQMSRLSLPCSPRTPQSTRPKELRNSISSLRMRCYDETSQIPLTKQLHAYSTPQLVNVIEKLLNNYPDLEEDVRRTLPIPDLQPLTDKLQKLLQHMQNVALSATRGDYANDTQSQLQNFEEFKNLCLNQGEMLCKTKNWDSVMSYILSSWSYISCLPRLHDNSQQAECYRGLTRLCTHALSEGKFTISSLCDFTRRLKEASLMNSEIQPCLKQIDGILASYSEERLS